MGPREVSPASRVAKRVGNSKIVSIDAVNELIAHPSDGANALLRAAVDALVAHLQG